MLKGTFWLESGLRGAAAAATQWPPPSVSLGLAAAAVMSADKPLTTAAFDSQRLVSLLEKRDLITVRGDFLFLVGGWTMLSPCCKEAAREQLCISSSISESWGAAADGKKRCLGFLGGSLFCRRLVFPWEKGDCWGSGEEAPGWEESREEVVEGVIVLALPESKSLNQLRVSVFSFRRRKLKKDFFFFFFPSYKMQQ